MSCGEPYNPKDPVGMEYTFTEPKKEEVTLSDANPFARAFIDEHDEAIESQYRETLLETIQTQSALDKFAQLWNVNADKDDEDSDGESIPYEGTCAKSPGVKAEDILAKIRGRMNSTKKAFGPEHVADQKYLDQQVSKSYVDNNADAGSIRLDTDTNQIMVADGSGDWMLTAASPSTFMEDALIVRTPSGQEIDVGDTIMKLEQRIEDLEHEALGHKIHKLADEIDAQKKENGDAYITVYGTCAEMIEQLSDQDKADSYNRAMGGI